MNSFSKKFLEICIELNCLHVIASTRILEVSNLQGSEVMQLSPDYIILRVSLILSTVCMSSIWIMVLAFTPSKVFLIVVYSFYNSSSFNSPPSLSISSLS